MLGLTLPNNNLQSLTKRVGTAPQSCVQLVYCMEIIISQTVSPFPRFNVVAIMIIKPLCAAQPPLTRHLDCVKH